MDIVLRVTSIEEEQIERNLELSNIKLLAFITLEFEGCATPPKRRKFSKNLFMMRTSSMGLYTLIRQLSDDQKEAANAIGFGGLLPLGISKYHVEFSREIARTFDYRRSAHILQNGDKVEIGEDVVQCILDIPRGEIQITESIEDDLKDPEYNEALMKWRGRWGFLQNSGAPKTNDMPKKILENRAADNDFKSIIHLLS